MLKEEGSLERIITFELVDELKRWILYLCVDPFKVSVPCAHFK
jgi:hypothetical protein